MEESLSRGIQFFFFLQNSEDNIAKCIKDKTTTKYSGNKEEEKRKKGFVGK